jgi:hypothetical protein
VSFAVFVEPVFLEELAMTWTGLSEGKEGVGVVGAAAVPVGASEPLHAGPVESPAALVEAA